MEDTKEPKLRIHFTNMQLADALSDYFRKEIQSLDKKANYRLTISIEEDGGFLNLTEMSEQEVADLAERGGKCKEM